MPEINLADLAANKLARNTNGKLLKEAFGSEIARYGVHRNFVATQLGKLGVADLERLATALFVTAKSDGHASVDQRAQEIVRLKPHVTAEQAHVAVGEVDRMAREWAACDAVSDLQLVWWSRIQECCWIDWRTEIGRVAAIFVTCWRQEAPAASSTRNRE